VKHPHPTLLHFSFLAVGRLAKFNASDLHSGVTCMNLGGGQNYSNKTVRAFCQSLPANDSSAPYKVHEKCPENPNQYIQRNTTSVPQRRILL
jgi:hypothetical protein